MKLHTRSVVQNKISSTRRLCAVSAACVLALGTALPAQALDYVWLGGGNSFINGAVNKAGIVRASGGSTTLAASGSINGALALDDGTVFNEGSNRPTSLSLVTRVQRNKDLWRAHARDCDCDCDYAHTNG